MKTTKILALIMIISLMISSVAYAASDSVENATNDITDYVVLDEQIDISEVGGNNLDSGISLYSDSFAACNFNMTCHTDYLHIYFSTGYSKKVDKIGMYDFKLQKKVWYGWKTMFSRSELYNTNSAFCSRGYDLEAEHGETYRLTGTHFIIDNGKTRKLSATSGELKYK